MLLEAALKLITPIVIYLLKKDGEKEIAPKKNWLLIRANQSKTNLALLEVIEARDFISIGKIQNEHNFDCVTHRLRTLRAYGFIKQDRELWAITAEYKPHIPTSDITTFARSD